MSLLLLLSIQYVSEQWFQDFKTLRLFSINTFRAPEFQGRFHESRQIQLPMVETFQFRILLFLHNQQCLDPSLVERLEIVVWQHDVRNIVSHVGRSGTQSVSLVTSGAFLFLLSLSTS